MANGANGKTLIRVLAVLFMGLAFAACAVMLSADNGSLFAEGDYGGGRQTAAR